MRCSTCGEALQAGASRCPTCGAGTPAGVSLMRATPVRRCPRCAYQGEGVPYFRRLTHAALLVAVGIPTSGFGSLIYWFARWKHRVCPRCGLPWENASRLLGVAADGESRLVEAEPDEPLPSSGIKRRVAGVVMVLLASLMVLMGIVEWEIPAVVFGAVLGAGGSSTFYWGWQALQGRRDAIMQNLQRRILRLAQLKGGTLTVTEVAAEMNLSLPAAEKILISMDDGFRVRSEISREGVLYYEFPEVRHRGELGAGSS